MTIEVKENRVGGVTEYKQGNIYLTHTAWEDGHHEIEVHRVAVEQLFYTCDIKELPKAENLFKQLVEDSTKNNLKKLS